MAKTWTVDGVHFGKKMTKLPITYLLWFVGSPIMRRVRWDQCQNALREIRRRLVSGVDDVEADLIDDLQPRSVQERLMMKRRNISYIQQRTEKRIL